MRASFVHSGSPEMGSYRLRAEIPARELGIPLNDKTADVLVLSKPMEHELPLLDSGKTIIVDFCDPHFARFKHYREFLARADVLVTSSEILRQIIASQGRDATVITDPYDGEQEAPHTNGAKCMWFGGTTNLHTFHRIAHDLKGYEVRVLCNAVGFEPLTHESRKQAFAWADIVVIPATEAYKNPNRAVAAIRAGCLVVAEPHPAFVGMPVYVGNIKEGIEWARTNPQKAMNLVRLGQDYICQRYSPSTVASAWRTVIQSACTLGAENTAGRVGTTATSATPIPTATFDSFLSRTHTQTRQLPFTL